MTHALHTIVFLLLATPALAQSPLASLAPCGTTLDVELRLELHAHPYPMAQPSPSLDLRHDLRPTAPPPEQLRLDLRAHRSLTLYLTADLSGNLPRLDAVDGETYFTVGAEFALTPSLKLFLESFQSSSAVLGGDVDPLDPVADMSWDGSQVTLGGRWQLSEWVRLEGGPVLYALSDSNRSEGLGARGALVFSF